MPAEPEVLVQFIIGGAQKGGTTALYTYLRQHAQLYLPKRKELHLFDRDRRYRRHREQGFRQYRRHFADAPKGAVCGEGTPAYMYYYKAPGRIWRYNPDMKWLMVLRNPITRAYSHWNMSRERGRERLAFGEAIRCERTGNRGALPRQNRSRSYVDRGFYVEQIRRVWHFFPREQTHIIKSDRLREKPAEVLPEVCAFLGVEPMTDVEPLERHARRYAMELEPADRAYLEHTYELEIRQLERLLGWDCSDWLADRPMTT